MTAYEAAILDVDGTIVRGDELIPDASDGVWALDDAGCSRLLFSNNPTRGSDHYGDVLDPHGITVDPDHVLTSAVVATEYLAATHPDERVYLAGSDRLETILADGNVELTDDPDAAEVVLGSYDEEFSFATLTECLRALDGDVPFYGTDPDTTIPVEGGTIPGSGAILAAMEAVAGREPDAVLGKPSSIAAAAAMDRLDADPTETLVVGDRLDTDIALGNRAGMTTAVVLTGVTDRATIETASIEPDHVLASLAEVERLL